MTSSLGSSIVVAVTEVTQVGEARRRSVDLAAQLGFDQTRQGKAALVVTEAASNLVKHAGGGQLILAGFTYGQGGAHLEIWTLDSGRGMNDLSRCIADGYSSAGSPGNGLGAISRVADSFEIYSGSESGTVLWARLDANPELRAHRRDELNLGVVRVAAPGEQLCGDDWAMIARDGLSFILMVDGLGHGPPAAHAAAEAVRIFQEHRSSEPVEIIESTHRAIRATRGAALAIVRLDLANGEVRYAGVGNICGGVLDTKTGESTSMVSHNGTVGFAIRKIQSYDYPWSEESLLVMHSDGLATHWNLDRYPGIAQRHPSLIAGALYRDHKRGRDDVTVLVARRERGQSP
jgi:anti-sigma regulatory factor (Ser/Thr protein kinase)